MIERTVKFHLEHLKRTFHTVPAVRSLGCYINNPEPRKQLFEAFGFGLRFDGNPAGKLFGINGKTYSVREYPYVMLKRPGEWHETSGVVYYSYLFFSYPKTMTEALVKLGFSDDFVCCELPRKTAFYEIFREIQTEILHLDEFGTIDRIDMLCFQIVREILLARKLEQTPLAEADEKIRRIASYLRLNCMQEIDFDELARQHGFSRRTFSRHWEKSGYPSPAQFLFELRMMEAKRLLAETSTPIWKIAELLHYQGSAWFCFSFRKHTGETPLGLRKRSQRPSGLELN